MKIREISEQVIERPHRNGYRECRIPGIIVPQPDEIFLCLEARKGEGDQNLGDWGDIDLFVLHLNEGMVPRNVLTITGHARIREQDGVSRPAEGESRGQDRQDPSGTAGVSMCCNSNPVLLWDNGRIHLVFHFNYEEAFLTSSDDMGRHWSQPRNITSVFREFPWTWNVCASGPGHGTKLRSGRLVVPIWLANGAAAADGIRRDHFPSVCGCIYSDDGAQTFHPGFLERELADPSETCCAELADGKLLFNFRHTGPQRRRAQAISRDGGCTAGPVSFPEELIDPICFGSLVSDAPEDPSAPHVFFVNCKSQTGRENITVRHLDRRTGFWEEIWHVDDLGGYPDIALNGNDLYVFYERMSEENGLPGLELVLKHGKITA